MAGLGLNAILFEALSSNAAIPDSAHLKLCDHLGSGVSSCEPMALVVKVAEVRKQSSGHDEAKELSKNPDPHERHYSMPIIFIIVLVLIIYSILLCI